MDAYRYDTLPIWVVFILDMIVDRTESSIAI